MTLFDRPRDGSGVRARWRAKSHNRGYVKSRPVATEQGWSDAVQYPALLDPAWVSTGSYACDPAFGACLRDCRSSADCAPGNACDLASGRCVAAAPASDDGGCAVGPRGAGSPADGARRDGALGAGGTAPVATLIQHRVTGRSRYLRGVKITSARNGRPFDPRGSEIA